MGIIHSQVRGTCHHGRDYYTSINQSIKQKAPSYSINQSSHDLLLIFIDSTNQAINQSTNQLHDKSIPNQSINRQITIHTYVISYVRIKEKFEFGFLLNLEEFLWKRQKFFKDKNSFGSFIKNWISTEKRNLSEETKFQYSKTCQLEISLKFGKLTKIDSWKENLD